jgi:hypothetical protein
MQSACYRAIGMAKLFAMMLQLDTGGGDSAYRHMLAFHRYNDQRDEPRALQHLEETLAASGTCGKQVRTGVSRRQAVRAPCCAVTPLLREPGLRGLRSCANRPRGTMSRRTLAQSEGRYADAQKAWDATLAFLARARMEEYRDWCRAQLEKSAHSTVTPEPRTAEAGHA